MKWPPTDLQILKEIYQRYYAKFADYIKKSPNRATKVYGPINIEELAEPFGIAAVSLSQPPPTVKPAARIDGPLACHSAADSIMT